MCKIKNNTTSYSHTHSNIPSTSRWLQRDTNTRDLFALRASLDTALMKQGSKGASVDTELMKQGSGGVGSSGPARNSRSTDVGEDAVKQRASQQEADGAMKGIGDVVQSSEDMVMMGVEEEDVVLLEENKQEGNEQEEEGVCGQVVGVAVQETQHGDEMAGNAAQHAAPTHTTAPQQQQQLQVSHEQQQQPLSSSSSVCLTTPAAHGAIIHPDSNTQQQPPASSSAGGPLQPRDLFREGALGSGGAQHTTIVRSTSSGGSGALHGRSLSMGGGGLSGGGGVHGAGTASGGGGVHHRPQRSAEPAQFRRLLGETSPRVCACVGDGSIHTTQTFCAHPKPYPWHTVHPPHSSSPSSHCTQASTPGSSARSSRRPSLGNLEELHASLEVLGGEWSTLQQRIVSPRSTHKSLERHRSCAARVMQPVGSASGGSGGTNATEPHMTTHAPRDDVHGAAMPLSTTSNVGQTLSTPQGAHHQHRLSGTSASLPSMSLDDLLDSLPSCGSTVGVAPGGGGGQWQRDGQGIAQHRPMGSGGGIMSGGASVAHSSVGRQSQTGSGFDQRGFDCVVVNDGEKVTPQLVVKVQGGEQQVGVGIVGRVVLWWCDCVYTCTLLSDVHKNTVYIHKTQHHPRHTHSHSPEVPAVHVLLLPQWLVAHCNQGHAPPHASLPPPLVHLVVDAPTWCLLLTIPVKTQQARKRAPHRV